MANYLQEITLGLIDNVSKSSKGIVSSLNKIGLVSNDLNYQFNQVALASSAVISKLKYLGVAAFGAGLGILTLATRTSNAAEDMLNLSQRTGVSVEELQKLSYVAEQSGLSSDQLTQSFKFLNRAIADASSNMNGDAAAAFAGMNIDIKNSNGTLKSTDAILYELSDAFAKVEDGPRKVNTALKLLGRSGESLIPILNDGSAALKEQGDRFGKFANLMSAEQMRAIKDFGDKINDVMWAFKGLGSIVAQAVIPYLQPLVEDFSKWVASNKDLIRTNVTNFIEKISTTFKELWPQVKEAGTQFLDFIDRIGGIKTLLIGIAVVINGDLIASFVNLGIEVVKLGAILLANPIGLITAALVALGVALYDSQTGFEGLANKVVGTAQVMLEHLQPIIDVVKGIAAGIEDVMVAMGIIEEKDKVIKSDKKQFVSAPSAASVKDPITGKFSTAMHDQLIQQATGQMPGFDVNAGGKAFNELTSGLASKKDAMDINLKLNTENEVSYIDIDAPLSKTVNVDAGRMVTF